MILKKCIYLKNSFIAYKKINYLIDANNTIKETWNKFNGINLIGLLRNEQKKSLDHNQYKSSLLKKHSSAKDKSLKAGSIVTVIYKENATCSQEQRFTGILLAIRRNLSNPTFIVKSIIDGVGVEQVFSIFSPLISSILIQKRTIQVKSKTYWVRNHPEKLESLFEK